jgi:hypothetical protein
MNMLPGVIAPGAKTFGLQPAIHGTGRDVSKSRVSGHASSQFSPAPTRERNLFMLGQATRDGGDLHAHLRGKTPRRSTARRVSKLMGFDLLPTPFAHGAVGGAKSRGQLLIALFGFGMRLENDPSTQDQRLGCCVRSHQVL